MMQNRTYKNATSCVKRKGEKNIKNAVRALQDF